MACLPLSPPSPAPSAQASLPTVVKYAAIVMCHACQRMAVTMRSCIFACPF